MPTPNLQLPHRGLQVDAGALELMGKSAAQLAESTALSLTDAVVKTVSDHPELSSEHVRRVVEFANIEAFNQKYASLDPTMRVVDIDGGPADPQAVLQARAASVHAEPVMLSSLEYAGAPVLPGSTKTSSAAVFATRTRGGAIHDVDSLRLKLSAAHEEAVQSREVYKSYMNDALVKLSQATLSAAHQGATAGEVYAAWHSCNEELAQIAFEKVKHFFQGEQSKIAGRSIHPQAAVRLEFENFARKTASFLAYTQEVQNLETELLRVRGWLREQGVPA